MATQYSNKPIVTDGLVYALDFGNPKSYVSGSSTAQSLKYFTTTASLSGNPTFEELEGLLNLGANKNVLTRKTFSELTINKAFTICTLVRVKSGGVFWNQDSSPSDASSKLDTNSTSLGHLVVSSTYLQGSDFRRKYPADLTELTHITYRSLSGSLDVFINGVPVNTTGDVSMLRGSGLNLNGRNNNDSFWSGSIGNFYIYNRDLTSDEIYQNYLITAQRYGLSTDPKPYTVDENAYLFLQKTGITDPIITSSIDTFVRGLKANNLWHKMAVIYPFVGTGSEGINLTGSQKWNLKEPGIYPLSYNGAWEGSTSGSAPSGSGTYITPGVSPTSTFPYYVANNYHMSILSYDTPASSSYLMGTGMTEDLAVSTLAGDYGTPAAAYSVRKVRTAYSGALMDVRRSLDNVTSSIGYVSNGDLDTGSLVNFVKAEGENTPGEYEGLAAAYSLRKVSASYSGSAIEANNGLVYKNIEFTDSGVLDTASLDPIIATGSNVLPGEYSGLAAAYSLRKVNSAYTGDAIQISSSEGLTKDIGFDTKGNLDTGSLLNAVTTGSGILPGQYDGLAAAYSLRKVSASYDGFAIKVRGDIENQVRDIGFTDSGDLDTGSLLNFTATGSNTLAGDYSGLAAAYSLRKVVSGYTGDLIEVQSGSVSQSIGFDSLGNLDTGSLLTFVGSGNGFVKIWYDQSGNNNHATQSVAANQPQIVSNGAYLGFLDLNNSDTLLSTTATYTAGVDTTFQVAQATTGRNVFGAFEGTGKYYGVAESGNTGSPHHGTFTNVNYYVNSRTLTTPTRDDLWNELSVSKSLLTVTLGSEVDDSGVRLGYASSWINQNLYEFILYNSDQTSNRTYIENNINAYYDIYTTSSTSTENAYVSTWYDQSGNGNHATQTTASNQPLIVSSGSLITENGKPALSFDGSSDQLQTGTFVLNQPTTQFGVGKIDPSYSTSTNYTFASSTNTNNRQHFYYRSTGQIAMYSGNGIEGTGGSTSTHFVFSALFNSPNSELYFNNLFITGGDSGNYNFGGNLLIGNQAGNFPWFGKQQELLIYSGSQSANRTYIENNINAYYDIYNTTSETTEDAYVSKWYDQSGNNNHATQSAAANQPQIVSAGSILVDNNKPTVTFDGVSSFLKTNNSVLSTDFGIFAVAKTPDAGSNRNGFVLSQYAVNDANRFYVAIDRPADNVIVGVQIGSQFDTKTGTPVYDQKTYYWDRNGSTVQFSDNSASLTTSTNSTTIQNSSLGLGGFEAGQRSLINIQEAIIYSSSQATTRTYIENNINAYYDIYTTSSTSTENAYVSTWYDQSGNGRHATQVSASRQPLIVSSGSLITENGKPALSFDGVDDSLTMGGLHGQSILDQYFVTSTSDTTYIYPNSAGGTPYGFEAESGNVSDGRGSGYGTGLLYANGVETTGYTRDDIYNATVGYKTVVHQGADTSGWSSYEFGARAAFEYSGSLQELIAYTSSQAANRPLIENNINNYYNIYTGSNHGFVERWYDQSGNDNHAVQTSAGSQPLIVISGSLNLNDNKPGLFFTSSQWLNYDGTSFANSNLSLYLVHNRNSSKNQNYILGGTVASTRSNLHLGYRDTSYYFSVDLYGDIIGTSGLPTFIGPVNSLGEYYITNTGKEIRLITSTGSYSNTNTDTDKLIAYSGATIGKYGGSAAFAGTLNEYVAYTQDQTLNKEAIRYGINNYYNIYTQPTSSNWTTSSFTIKADSTSISGSLNNKLTSGIQSSGPLGLVTVSRTGSDSLTLARNGAATSFTVPASGALSTGLYLGAINNNGTALGNSPLNLSFASVGTGLTNSETGILGAEVTYFKALLNSHKYTPELLAILNRANSEGITVPSPSELEIQNQFIQDLKAGLVNGTNVWDSLDMLRLFANSNEDMTLIDYKNPTTVPVGEFVGSPTFTQNVGLAGNGATSTYYQTNFTPSIHAVNMVVGNGHLGYYRTSETTLGGSGGSNYHNSGLYSNSTAKDSVNIASDNRFTFALQNPTNNAKTVDLGEQPINVLVSVKRGGDVSSTRFYGYIDTTQKSYNSPTVTALPTAPYRALYRRNDNNAMIFSGASLTFAQMDDLKAAIEAYLAAISS